MNSTDLNLAGDFYPAFIAKDQRYGEADRRCIENTVTRLLAEQTSTARPGMLLGKIQSGKTKTFLGTVLLAFDNGFDIAIILTKGTKALARQTLARVRREFSTFGTEDRMQMFDIMTIPSGLTPYELNQKLVFVVKKQTDNLDRLEALFRRTYPALANRRALLIDDEADYASIGFRNTKAEGLVINTTTQQIETLRRLLPSSAFLQVTATPYALYLQPEELKVDGREFRPVRPAFTELVPVHPNYVGGDHYFERSQNGGDVASYIYQPVGAAELRILHHSDRRSFRVEECLTSKAIPTLRAAICNFIVGGCIRRLQDARAGAPPKKFSFLVHTEAGKAAHAWQETIVLEMNAKLTAAATHDPELLRELFQIAYDDLRCSIDTLGHYLPPFEEMLAEAFTALEQGWLMITKVNSEKQVEELLDDEGQLRLRTPLNIFIGGQILDRGITIANLIGFYYGRNPQVFQQDTVLQHSRMFGFRPLEDLTVTRFYTEPRIHAAMRRMHESDVALRESFENQPDQGVVFVRQDDHGGVIPCSPNKILVSSTTTLRPFKRILPVGFQTDFATRVRPVLKKIETLLKKLAPDDRFDEPFEIPLEAGLQLLELIEPTLLMETEEGYDDWDAAPTALAYMSNNAADPVRRGTLWCLVRGDRNMSRRIKAGAGQAYADAPDTTHIEGTIARRVAADTPMLMLFRQNGAEEQGWRGTPFFWPVIYAPRGTRTTIFAHETTR